MPAQDRTRSSQKRALRRRLVRGAPQAKHLDRVAPSLKLDEWHRFTLQEGSKGPLVANIVAIRMTRVEDKLPGREEWVVFRRRVNGAGPALKIYRCNAPADTPLEALARMTAMGWPVESTIEECKTELGLDQSARLDRLAPSYDHDHAVASFPGSVAPRDGGPGPGPDGVAGPSVVECYLA